MNADTTNMTTTAAPEVKKFETQPCGRCGGTGHYSYCQMYGTTCFQCAGRREVYTKRGLAAKNHLTALRSRAASALKVGDKIKGSSGKFEEITEIRVHNPEVDGGRIVNGTVPVDGMTITTARCRYISVPADRAYEVLLSKDEQAATFAAAKAYEATLTKAGTPRKR
jgi:hypothetical protein